MTPRTRRANQAVEFALVLPVLLAVVSGIADYGWYLSQHVGITEAAREGARSASTAWFDEDHVAIGQAAAGEVLDHWGIDDATVSVTLGTDAVLGRVVHVQVSAPYDPLLHLVPAPETLSQTVEMRTEWQPVPET